MRVLILGAGGMLGHDLVEAFSGQDVIPLSRQELDITDRERVRSLFSEQKPGMVVNAAAYTDVDGAESNKEQCFRVNGYGAGNVAEACGESGIALVQVSTDYVFDGTNRAGYREEDPSHPINAYGASKALGEEMVRKHARKHFIVRSSWLFGRHGRSFVATILRLCRERESIEVVDDQHGSPTYTKDLAVKIAELINTQPYGTYHVTNSGSCSWYAFAGKIVELAGLNTRVLPTTSGKLGRPARRPEFSMLLSTKLPPLRRWEEALAEYMSELGP